MAAQLLKRQTVDVHSSGVCIGNDKILFGCLGEVLDFIQLVDADVTTQSLSVADNLTGIVGADARHLLQLCCIGRIQYEMLDSL